MSTSKFNKAIPFFKRQYFQKTSKRPILLKVIDNQKVGEESELAIIVAIDHGLWFKKFSVFHLFHVELKRGWSVFLQIVWPIRDFLLRIMIKIPGCIKVCGMKRGGRASFSPFSMQKMCYLEKNRWIFISPKSFNRFSSVYLLSLILFVLHFFLLYTGV